MTCNEGTKSDNEEFQNQLAQQVLTSVEEVRILKQEMVEMYQAWINRQALALSIPGYSDMIMSSPIQVLTIDPLYPHGFGLYVHTSNIA